MYMGKFLYRVQQQCTITTTVVYPMAKTMAKITALFPPAHGQLWTQVVVPVVVVLIIQFSDPLGAERAHKIVLTVITSWSLVYTLEWPNLYNSNTSKSSYNPVCGKCKTGIFLRESKNVYMLVVMFSYTSTYVRTTPAKKL